MCNDEYYAEKKARKIVWNLGTEIVVNGKCYLLEVSINVRDDLGILASCGDLLKEG